MILWLGALHNFKMVTGKLSPGRLPPTKSSLGFGLGLGSGLGWGAIFRGAIFQWATFLGFFKMWLDKYFLNSWYRNSGKIMKMYWENVNVLSDQTSL